MAGRYYLGLDQGTIGTTAILFDQSWHEVSRGYCEIPVFYPQPGWVEHDPEDVWHSILSATEQALRNVGADAASLLCIGLNHEGESVVIWDPETGLPVYPAITWQDRRTVRMAEELAYEYNDLVLKKTGLMIDSYFSAVKYKWILDHIQKTGRSEKKKRLMAGTMDTWIIWKLTRGALHITDASTASRTMLFHLDENRWDEELISLFGLENLIFPEIQDSAARYCFTDPEAFFGARVPVSAILVDQQAALIGNGCVEQGSIKATYGTGCFMLMNTGDSVVRSSHGLLPTIAWRLNGKTTYALDGGVYIAGGAVKWLQKGLEIVASPDETETLAGSVRSNGGVYFVPAFTGLAAPYWDSYASGMMIGINSSTQKGHIARAALEAIAYQVRDVLDAMAHDAQVPITTMRCNGSPTANSFLMQFQADILGVALEIPQVSNATALGSAFMGALGIGDFDSIDDISRLWSVSRRYEPKMGADERNSLLYNWHRAVERAKYWNE
ncbi:glycerol kinase GlpK [uncultured Dysosmobacter sp.]|uniref:glycerol kinase GlpK n=1 Tax=uncultured Dysosmobacter sp. TaxID=2591384 RepID=UPI002630C2E2|nr:glycerol kinase GlpK [uncultured Dysosmobacter sp.]